MKNSLNEKLKQQVQSTSEVSKEIQQTQAYMLYSGYCIQLHCFNHILYWQFRKKLIKMLKVTSEF